MSSSWTRLVRYIPVSGGDPRIGEPVDPNQDVGLACYAGHSVEVHMFSGLSILDPGEPIGRVERIGQLYRLLEPDQVGTIRCIGLNIRYRSHAREMKYDIPVVPTVFLKPHLALSGPHPASIVLPKNFVKDDAADWESELALVIGKDCKNVSVDQAMDHLLGFTAANDISSRKVQFEITQWDYSKGFDGSCPIGPALVSRDALKDSLSEARIRGSLNGTTVQDCQLDDLIFSVPRIISHLSQGTTLPVGTVIITGTPPGVGWASTPRRTLQAGDEFTVSITHGIGSLINRVVVET